MAGRPVPLQAPGIRHAQTCGRIKRSDNVAAAVSYALRCRPRTGAEGARSSRPADRRASQARSVRTWPRAHGLHLQRQSRCVRAHTANSRPTGLTAARIARVTAVDIVLAVRRGYRAFESLQGRRARNSREHQHACQCAVTQATCHERSPSIRILLAIEHRGRAAVQGGMGLRWIMSPLHARRRRTLTLRSAFFDDTRNPAAPRRSMIPMSSGVIGTPFSISARKFM